MVVGVAKFSKSPSIDLEEREEQVEDKFIAFQEPSGRLASKGCFSIPPP